MQPSTLSGLKQKEIFFSYSTSLDVGLIAKVSWKSQNFKHVQKALGAFNRK